jgi:hypothetical protein
MLRYAGIGSRETPKDILHEMFIIATELAGRWVLRSGYADGADSAFSNGALLQGGEVEIFVPWPGYNGAPKDDPSIIVPPMTPRLLAIAEMHHPAWDRCSQGAKKLHARNGCQILGLDLNTPVDMVICWTKGGLRQGGTGQALRLAKYWDIPIFDLALSESWNSLYEFVTERENLVLS